MFKVLLAAHLVLAVFAIGPLVYAVTTAGRGLRLGDAAATAHSARVARGYAYASVLVIIAGFGLMSSTSPYSHTTTASFGDTYIWLSLLLWLVAIGLTLAVIAPTLDRAAALIGGGQQPGALTARVAAGGGVVGLIFAVVIVLMVYRPGG